MAEITQLFQFATLENLELFKDLLDANTLKSIDEKMSSAIQTVSQSADKLTIYFYTKKAPVTENEAAFSVRLPAAVDISGKADKVKNAVAGHFACLDANGNLTDSGNKASDFEVSGAALAAKNELLTLIGSIPAGASAKTVIAYIQEAVAAGTYDDSDIRGLITELQKAVDVLNGSGEGSVQKQIQTLSSELKAMIGTLSDLSTTSKQNLVSAINEIVDELKTIETAGKITIDTTSTSAGMLKSYTVKQGDTTIGVIDVPKDMVVQSGKVVVNPTGQPAGTYIELTLANATADKIYVNVGTLVDIYTAETSAAQIQLSINPSTRVLSAKIVAGSVGSTELASNAVTTIKIKDGAVTLGKLATEITTLLNKAGTAIQSVTAGTANGTIAVDGTNVAVPGLKSAAYKDETAFESAGTVKSLADGAVAANTADIAANTSAINALENLVGNGFESIPENSIRALFS